MNYRILIILTLILTSAFACKTNSKAVKTEFKQDDYVVFSFRKTGCRGTCPVYYLEIFRSGKMNFEGIKHVDKIGLYTKNINPKQVEDLIKEFQEVNFEGFKDKYTAMVTDLPTTYTSFTNNGKTKKIMNYHGAPQELKKLERKLERIARSNQWIIKE